MNHRTKPTPLKALIYVHFGGFQGLAKLLAIAPSTISDWTTSNPRNALKYLPEIAEAADVPYTEFVDVVLKTEEGLNQQPQT